MKAVSGKDMRAILERLGWSLKRVTGSHHFFTRPGNLNTVNVPIHGSKTLKPGTQKRIMKDAGLTDADL